ncbi:3-hydroxyisobutyrate dehydrogenase [Variibacter gotjawalensis]|uniref:3-hydroxyisobutyrate dehydrogenase n=1 Tax=Variibacter gotjawalensis TaxID=1333996 RepID=A0A0S3PXF5_9BRAD|nr:3-hydroxyisobutyrate dehydrogenase [Variibacter gotjawalensis]NIK46409.1 3-hydroxyisobutyrate dehydrogenase [Variibacter gotjawalensis]RZS48319.1 3-hydroxyisobutyrate dehydrogenase [Variibacter gotjawalensis]BAT60579.1 3-hydroxyisobutyrate dehydrogenase [Variibacter gotjawalensis]
MAKIGFIGLGNMGLPMALNLIKAGHEVVGFDLSKDALEKLGAAGGKSAASTTAACEGCEVIVTMLPAGQHVRGVYTGANGIIANAKGNPLLIDCSTIDVDSARAVTAAAKEKGLDMVDAPVSGGVGGAQGATLTFMVGGEDKAFARAKPYLEQMGKTIVHAGGAGNGQAAKICNNMILGISMLAVSEGFVLAEKLGLDAQKLFDIASKSSGSCWAMVNYCPVPGPVPTSPANRDYAPGFTGAMMLKDMKLSQDAAKSAGAKTEIGAHAAELYEKYADSGNAARDFSGIVQQIRQAK